MASFNKVVLMGNLTRDPELKYLPNGNAVCNFSIASNDGYKEKEHVSYFDVAVFGKLAENVNEYMKKGRTVLIEGKLQQRRWDAKDGSKRSKVEIVALDVVFIGKGEKKEESFDTVSEEDIPFN